MKHSGLEPLPSHELISSIEFHTTPSISRYPHNEARQLRLPTSLPVSEGCNIRRILVRTIAC
ncbi:hypothetical protein M3J09_011600 [Ascochyta lentis]